MEIRVKCKKCGRSAKPEEFVLDHVYKLMVCPLCIKDRKLSEQIKEDLKSQKKAPKEENKPAGWDKEDEYLERSYKREIGNTVKVEKIDDERVRYKCPHCGYTFMYILSKKNPSSCPYCDSPIGRMVF